MAVSLWLAGVYAGAGASGGGRLGAGSGSTPSLMGTDAADDRFARFVNWASRLRSNAALARSDTFRRFAAFLTWLSIFEVNKDAGIAPLRIGFEGSMMPVRSSEASKAPMIPTPNRSKPTTGR